MSEGHDHAHLYCNPGTNGDEKHEHVHDHEATPDGIDVRG
jgi:hypothetical protein